MKKIIICSIGLLFQLGAFAQQSFDLKSADGFYKKGEYYNAIVSYEVYLGIRKPITQFTPYGQKKKVVTTKADSSAVADNIIATSKLVTNSVAYKLGESYRQQNHYLRAEKCYARLLQNPTDTAYSMARYWYGVSLRCNNKFDEARKQFNSFISEQSSDKSNVALGRKELATLDYISAQMKNPNQKLYTVKKLSGNIAQAEGAYAPVFIKDTLVFTSARIVDTVNKYSSTNSHVNHLFYNTITKEDAIDGKAVMVKFPSRLSINEATASFTPDSKRLYFSRGSFIKGKESYSIYVSSKKGDGNWAEPTKLSDAVNKEGFNSIQPSVADDGRYLLFSSDREGGAGKYDIWCAPIDASGNVSEAFNLVGINTKEDEQSPYYHSFSKTLVFASKGYLGMGGFDMYSSIGEIKSLQPPVNLGYPVNSPKDDQYFFSTSKDSMLKKAYISSDRASDCCLEVFALTKIIKVKHKQSIEGTITDCYTGKPITSTIKVGSLTGAYTISSGNKGSFKIIVADSITGFEVSKDAYKTKSEPFNLVAEIANDTVYKVSICLDTLEMPKSVEQVKDSINISNKPLIIYFDFAKSDIKTESIPVLDEVVSILKKYPTITLALEINGYTDAKGTDAYNLKLGKDRAEAAQKYIIGQGIDLNRMSLKSYGKSLPVAPNTTADNKDNPEGRALNRRVEITIKAASNK